MTTKKKPEPLKCDLEMKLSKRVVQGAISVQVEKELASPVRVVGLTLHRNGEVTVMVDRLPLNEKIRIVGPPIPFVHSDAPLAAERELDKLLQGDDDDDLTMQEL